jgi:hypothetical protein
MKRFGKVLLVIVLGAILLGIGLTVSHAAAQEPVSDDPFAWI